MNIQQLEYFITLAQTEHMTKTAKLVNTSQPNLSYAMNELEKELGAPLIKRVGRNIKLTQYGRLFYEYADRSLKELNNGMQAIEELINPYSGTIRFGFIYTMGAKIAPQVVRQFQDIPENQDIRFEFMQGNSQEIVQALIDEKIDVALCSIPSNSPLIDSEPLLSEDLVLVVPQDHPLADSDSVNLADTMSYPYISYIEDSGLRTFIDQQFKSLDLSPTNEIFVEEDHTLLGFVSAGYGIGIMPDIPSIAAYPVKKITISDPIEERLIYLTTAKDGFVNKPTQRFIDFMQYLK